MDPLSVAASIVGLLTAAGKIHALLETLSSIRNAPSTIREAQRETRHTEIALRSLHRFLHRLDPANPRLELIQVDELRVVLADAMLIFSSFESILQSLAGLARVRVTISWTKYTKQIDEHLAKLERYKSSLAFMLSILQCNSDSEARLNQVKLQGLVEQSLAENAELRHKLQQSQDSFDARSAATRHPDNGARTVRDYGDDTSTIRGIDIAHRDPVGPDALNNLRNSIIKFAFENILEESRVYRKTTRLQECDQSFNSSAIRSHAWSIFTGYSLAEISVLSVIAMPLCKADVVNGGYYDVSVVSGDMGQYLNSEGEQEVNPGGIHHTIPSGTSLTLTALDEHSRSPQSQFTGLSEPTTPDARAITAPAAKIALGDENFGESGASFKTVESSVSGSSNDTYMTTDNTSMVSETDATSLDNISTKSNSSSVDGDCSPILEFPKYQASGSSIPRSSNDEDEADYPCARCGEILESGPAFQIRDRRWHIACLKCDTCNIPFNADSEILPLDDGTLMCRDCTYRCYECGKKIEDHAILTGDKAYCLKCFRCRRCKRKIEDLRYAKTPSQGIFCMRCHEILIAKREARREKMKEKEKARFEAGAGGGSVVGGELAAGGEPAGGLNKGGQSQV